MQLQHLQPWPASDRALAAERGWGYIQETWTFYINFKTHILTRFNQNNLHSHNEIKIFEQYQNMEKPQCVI